MNVGMVVESSSANVAKERLKLILAHQRGSMALEGVNVSLLQHELLQCIKKHIQVAPEADVRVNVKHDSHFDIFEMQVPVNESSRGN